MNYLQKSKKKIEKAADLIWRKRASLSYCKLKAPAVGLPFRAGK